MKFFSFILTQVAKILFFTEDFYEMGIVLWVADKIGKIGI